ncbi:MAG: transglycosylase SLT domain-containing protein [Alphaproteobacteria bacterium]
MNIDIAPNNYKIDLGGYSINETTFAHISDASRLTGTSLEYLLAKAGQESSFAPNAKSLSSSAAGLYQFTENTWLQQFKLHAAKYGYNEFAKHITSDARGHFDVDDKKIKNKILALRKDTKISSLLAAELARTNQAILEKELNIEATPSDLYLAHFLGINGAISLLKAIDENPKQNACSLFPEAAKANTRVFYKEKGKKPRNVKEVYTFISKLFEISAKRITNIPTSIIATLPKMLPKANLKTDLRLENKKANQFSQIDHNVDIFHINDFKSIENNGNNDFNSLNFKDILTINNTVPILPNKISARMIPEKKLAVDEKNVSLPEINFINEIIEHVTNK